MTTAHLLTRPLLAAALLSLPLLTTTSCQSKGQTGALGGAAVGAVAGQIIGGDTGATLLGAAVGAGAGYMIGNEKDKKDAAAHEQQAAKQGGTARPSPAAAAQPSPLTGTRWNVTSLAAANKVEYASKIVDFTASTLTCTTTTKDGKVSTVRDSYTVVGDALVINRPDGVINAQFALSGDQLIVNCNEFRAVLKRL